MTWAQQKKLVEMLSARATEKSREATRIRGKLRNWAASYLGSLDTLAWTFAIGAWWAAGRSSTDSQSKGRRALFAVINAFWLGWQLVNRQIKLTPPDMPFPIDDKQ